MKINGKTILSTSSTTTNYVLKQSSTIGTLINSQIFDNGTNVGIGTTTPNVYPFGGKLSVNGNISCPSTAKIGFGITDAFTLNGIDTPHYGISSGSGLTQLSGYSGLIFATQGAERMRITQAGNVGIGTSSPVAFLQVKTATNQNVGLFAGISGSTISSFNDDVNGNVELAFDSSTHKFNINGSEKMRITSSGNVGIGTTNPIYTSDTIGTVRATGGFQIGGSSGGSSQGQIAMSGSNTYFDYLGFLAFRQNFGASEAMRITSAGNVGIGTTNPEPSSLLDLNSITQGFLAPRMRTSERDSIGSPANGLTIFNTDSETIDVFTNGGGWKSLLF